METTLLTKVSLLLSLSLGLGALGSYNGRKITSLRTFFGLFIGLIVGIFMLEKCIAFSPVLGFVALCAWVYASGLFNGPALSYYTKRLGWETVMGVYLGTGGVMALGGAIGVCSGVDFSSLGALLEIALLGLIGVALFSIFFRLTPAEQKGRSIAGMVIFSLYFVYDFFLVLKTSNTWQNAEILAMNLYLDFLNFSQYALRYLEQMK